MMDIVQYRSRIGLFSQRVFRNKFLYKRQYYEKASWNRNQSGNITLCAIKFVFKFIFLCVLLTPPTGSTTPPSNLTRCCTTRCTGTASTTWIQASSLFTTGTRVGWAVGGGGDKVCISRRVGNWEFLGEICKW